MNRFIVDAPDDLTSDDISAVFYESGRYRSMQVSPVRETWQMANGKDRMTTAQRDKLWELCGRYNVEFRESDYFRDPQTCMVEGWVGGINHSAGMGSAQTIYVGVEPNGDSHS